MLSRFVFFLLGFGITVIGLVYLICLLNLMSIGYNFLEYVNFIIRRFELYYVPLGIIIMFIAVYLPGGNKNDLYIRYNSKF